MKRLSLPFLFFLLLSQGCIQQIAIRTMADIMDYGFDAYYQETDLMFAREGMAGNMKLLEALIQGDPSNRQLLLLASQGYSAYALAFAEDDSVERARVFYLRGRDYGLRVLREHQALAASIGADLQTFERALHALPNDEIPAVFWTAFAWGGYINISRTDLDAFADVPKVIAMMKFVAERDPGYYYGGAFLFLGAIEGTTPAMLGGKPERSKEHFEKALALSEGKFLLTYTYYASTYAVQVQDQELFEKCLKIVEDATLDILPEARLPNAVAKNKARILRRRMGEFF
ncbi:MAG: TRAP transporter TatT component family protein [Bacteroidota bacterium]